MEQTSSIIRVFANQYACLKSILLREGCFKYNFIYDKRDEKFDWSCAKELFQNKVDKYFKQSCDRVVGKYSIKYSK